MNRGIDNQKVLGNCPSCERLMQIPVVTDVASVAKCPHCHNEIRVRDLLASAVPEAEIVANDGDKDNNRVSDYIADRQRVYDDDKSKPREKFEVPNQLYNGASRRNRKRRGRSKGSSSRDSSSRRRSSNNGSSENGRAGISGSAAKAPSNGRAPKVDPNLRSNGNPTSESVSTTNSSATASRSATTSGAASTRSSAPASSPRPASSSSAAPKATQKRRVPESTPRPRRSSSRGRRSSEMDDEVEFGAADIFKFLIGGVIAAPLAYLALLWVLGVDPFGIASTFERVSPAIIPDSLRSEGFGDEPRTGFAPPTGDSSSMLFEPTADEEGSESGFDDAFQDEGLPLPSLDPDMVR